MISATPGRTRASAIPGNQRNKKSLIYAALEIPVLLAPSIAVLRHRLYEIDLIINCTLVYGVLATMLVGMYVASIVLLQGLLNALTGHESQLAIFASTLFVATFFNPLRRRIQGFIDRRFYRRKYDAAKALEAFSAKLRDETDLDALSDGLVGVVRETMQPAHISLWLHSNPSRRAGKGPEYVG
jgi:hypothetical protein